MAFSPNRFCIAPMMEWTDRHCRYFHRLLTRRALLYTEMITADAVLHGDRQRLLAFSEAEQPVALQLGGCDPEKLARAAAIGAEFGYREINLNVGCPSDRVQEGRFGACLMLEPELVAACVARMQAAVPVPITVKCRIGIDDQDSERDLERFVATVAAAGCRTFIVHARKAWLQGLSPKENRTIPPLDYGRVYRLKDAHPELTIVLNGGVASLAEALAHLKSVDGVMVGRAAYHDPYMLADADRRLFGEEASPPSRRDVVERLLPYLEAHLEAGGRLSAVTRHILGLYHGQPGGRAFRRRLTGTALRDSRGLAPLIEAMTAAERARDARSRRNAAAIGGSTLAAAE